jgi:hypothetical protein
MESTWIPDTVQGVGHAWIADLDAVGENRRAGTARRPRQSTRRSQQSERRGVVSSVSSGGSSDRARQIFQFIEHRIACGRPPSLEEIEAHFGLPSTPSARPLARSARLRRRRGDKAAG